MRSTMSSMENSWTQITASSDQIEIPDRVWMTAVPMDAPRADAFASKLPATTVAQLLPDVPQSKFQLVSSSPAPGCTITNVGGTTVKTAADFEIALASLEDSEKVQIDVVPAGSKDEMAVHVDRPTLLKLSQAIAAEQPTLRISEEGDPWLFIRDNGINAKVMLRVERRTSLLHVILSLANCSANPILLPVEVKAQCGEQPLSCLKVAATLDTLYGTGETEETQSSSFAVVSESEDYLLPTNYKQIAAQSERMVAANGFTLQPAFAALPGIAYPGPAPLADARSLAGFMMQQEELAPGDPERTGWIVFTGKSLREAKEVTLQLDLGAGPKPYRFMLP